MSIAVVVPVRSLAGGKARLAGVLDDETRAAFNTALLAHTLRLAASLSGLESTFVVSPDPSARAKAEAVGAALVDDPGDGLNPAIAAGREAAEKCGFDRILILPIDLPRAMPEDISALASCAASIVIAPDRHGTGTNALCLSAGLAFETRFGEDSFRAHIAEARHRCATAAIRPDPRLGLDIDTEADWDDWGRTLDRDAWIRRLGAG